MRVRSLRELHNLRKGEGPRGSAHLAEGGNGTVSNKTSGRNRAEWRLELESLECPTQGSFGRSALRGDAEAYNDGCKKAGLRSGGEYPGWGHTQKEEVRGRGNFTAWQRKYELLVKIKRGTAFSAGTGSIRAGVGDGLEGYGSHKI